MITFKKDMSVDYATMGCSVPPDKPTLTAYIVDQNLIDKTEWKKRPAIIVCPGGGYAFVSSREADPIALKYSAAGFHTFILDYSVSPTGWPAACCELSKTVAYVRSIADEYSIDKDKIIVCGFSAGGHLAASIGVHYDKEIIKKFSDVSGDENKPNGMILGYPVISDNLKKTHIGTYDNFTAEKENAKDYFGLEHYVNKNTPKTFLWHTYTDPAVPVYNTMVFANALMENDVNFELHIFPEGAHGLSLSNKVTSTAAEYEVSAVEPWIDMSIAWVNNF